MDWHAEPGSWRMAPETELDHRYVLKRPLGKGGWGEVWLAVDQKLKREVAVKVLLRAAPSTVTRQRFLREAALPAAVQHPGIIVVHDVGEHDQSLFIVTELLPGRDLSKVLADDYPRGMPADLVIDLGVQLADALAAAHEHRILHRDLKPSNLFVLPSGHLKIVDFGIAREMDGTRLTDPKHLLGTLPYMAPELMGGDATHSTDLFAVGCSLYEMLTSHLPASRLNPDPPGGGDQARLNDLVLRLLAKDPEDRPASAREVARELRGIRDSSTEQAAEARVRAEVRRTYQQTLMLPKSRPAAPAAAPVIACGPLSGGPFEVFLQNDAGRLAHVTRSGTTWESHPRISAPEPQVTAMAVGSHSKDIRVIAAVADGVPYLRRWEYEKRVWNCWADWIDARVDDDPASPGRVLDAALTRPAAGQLDLFTLDADGGICRRRFRPGQWLGQNWSAWERIPAPPGATALAAGGTADCQALAVVVDGAIYASVWLKGGWGAFDLLGFRPGGADVDIACASPGPGSLDLLALDSDGSIRHCTWIARGQAWSNWAALAGSAERITAIAAAAPSERRVAVTALGADGLARYADRPVLPGQKAQWSAWEIIPA